MNVPSFEIALRQGATKRLALTLWEC
jgi:hypothetical protein